MSVCRGLQRELTLGKLVCVPHGCFIVFVEYAALNAIAAVDTWWQVIDPKILEHLHLSSHQV